MSRRSSRRPAAADPTTLARSSPPRDDLVGRQEVLGLLEQAIDEAIRGRGGLVLLTGDPGIGKTAVASRATDHAAAGGARVLWASCWEGEGVPGYWPWLQVLRVLIAQVDTKVEEVSATAPLLTRLLRGATAAEHQADLGNEPAERVRFQLFDEVASFLVEQAVSRPLVVVFDDLHWADPASVLLIDFLARRLHTFPLLVIGTCREIEVSVDSPLASLLAGGAATTLALLPLSAAEVRSVMARVLSREPEPELAAAAHRMTAGNAFLVHQVARLLLTSSDGKELLRRGDIPEGVLEAVQRRLSRLSEQCRDLLEVASVLGPESAAERIASLSGRSVGTVRDLLVEATRAHILADPMEPLGRYRFTHDLFRESIYRSLSAVARARLHLAAGRALVAERAARGDVTLAELASHFVRAAEVGGQEDALHYSGLAAVEATRRLAYEEAAGHWERALAVQEAWAPGELGDCCEILLELADAHRRSGNLVAAQATYRRAAEPSCWRRWSPGLERTRWGQPSLASGRRHCSSRETARRCWRSLLR